MNTLILKKTALWCFPAFVVLSLVVLYRGHNLPGGGFIGGLLFSSAFILIAMACGTDTALKKLRFEPVIFIAAGLLLAVISGFIAVFMNQPFMTAIWLPGVSLPLLGKVHLGTPILFDIGVFLAVSGFTLKVFFNLSMEDKKWN